MPLYCRIWVLLRAREGLFYNPKEKYHWQLIVENEGKAIWSECHATETKPCVSDGQTVLVAEEFDLFAAVYPVTASQITNSCCMEVAMFEYEKRTHILDLISSIDLSDLRPKPATCRTFVQHVLQTLKNETTKYGIRWQKDFDEITKSLQDLAGPLEEFVPVIVEPEPEPEIKRSFKSLRKASSSQNMRSKKEDSPPLPFRMDDGESDDRSRFLALTPSPGGSPPGLRTRRIIHGKSPSINLPTPWARADEWAAKRDSSDDGTNSRRPSEPPPKNRRKLADSILALARRDTTPH